MSDLEEMFLAFKEEYLKAMQAKAIADRDAAQQVHQSCLEMAEMDAWDEFAIEALKAMKSELVDHLGSKESAEACAKFANELLAQRRKTFG